MKHTAGHFPLLIAAFCLIGCSSVTDPMYIAVEPPALSLFSLSSTSLRLEWQTVSDDAGTVTTYRVVRTTSGQGSEVVKLVTGTSFVETGLDSTAEYWYTIEPRSQTNPTRASFPAKTRFGPSFQKVFDLQCYGTAAYCPSLQILAVVHPYGETKMYSADSGAYIRSSAVRGGLADFSPDGSTLAVTSYYSGDDSGKVQIVRVNDGSLLASRKAHKGDVRMFNGPLIAYSRDGSMFVTAARNPSLLYRKASTGDIVFSVTDPGPGIHGLAVSPDGQWMATASDWTIKLRNFADARVVRVLEYHSSDVSALAFSADSKYLASSESSNGSICVWNTADGTLANTNQDFSTDNSGGISALAFTGNSSELYAGDNNGVLKLWSWRTFSLRYSWKGYWASVSAVFASSDSRVITVGSSSIISWARSGTGLWYFAP